MNFRYSLSALALFSFTFSGIAAPLSEESRDATAVSAIDPTHLVVFGTTGIVSSADWEAAVRAAPPSIQSDLRSNPKLGIQLLEGIMLNRMLAQDAHQLGLDNTNEVRAAIQQASDKILANRRLDQLEASVPIPDLTKAAREQYDLNRTKYVINERISTRHILIEANNRSDSEAKQLADTIRTRLLSGEEFETLAKEYSDDRVSKGAGGTLPDFQRGQMVKPFEEAAFALTAANEISSVVKTKFGYHIIQLIGRHAEQQLPFEAVEEKITAPIKSRIVNDERARFLSKFKSDPSIKINTEAIEQLMSGVSASKALPSTKNPN